MLWKTIVAVSIRLRSRKAFKSRRSDWFDKKRDYFLKVASINLRVMKLGASQT